MLAQLAQVLVAFLVLALATPALTTAQTVEQEKSMSKIEAFSAKGGSLLRKEFSEIGKFERVQVEVARFTQMCLRVRSDNVRHPNDDGCSKPV